MPSSNITLYSFGTPNGFKASITLEELNLPYKSEIIDIGKDTQKESWFLDINPNGRIPAIKDGDFRVFESGAIMLYLTDKYDKDQKISFSYGSDDYYEAMSWLMWQMGGLGPMQGQANHFKVHAEAKSEYAIKRYDDETRRLYTVLESRLKNHDWLVADKYSIADIASFGWARATYMIDLDLSEYPGVQRWINAIDKREAVQKGVQVGSSGTLEESKKNMADKRAKIAAMSNSDKH